MDFAKFVAERRLKFSRKQTNDLQSAMAEAIGTLLRNSEFPGPRGKGRIKFAAVYDEWPSSQDNALSPSACVRTPDSIKYAPALLTPTLLEETWEPVGQLGVGLYKLSEGECDFHLEVRAASRRERSALVAGIESLFVEPLVLNDKQIGGQYGRTLPMPSYWNLDVRIALQETLTSDDAESAKTNRWDSDFLVRAQANHVRLDVVSPFRLKIIEQFT
jgi:hypothetical protein